MANISFCMDDALKRNMETILEELGLNITTAMTMFAKAIVRENRLPLDLSLDPFYSRANQDHLERVISNYESGQGRFIPKTMVELERMESESRKA